MIRLENISKFYGAVALFSELSFHVKPGLRVGLVGDNGAGKTTLLNILAGDTTPDDGRRIVSSETRIGMLRQETGGDDNVSLLESVLAGAKWLNILQEKINECSDKLHKAERDGDMSAVERLAEALGDYQERFADMGGYALEGKAKAILSGLGFKPDEFGRPVDSFSGGWRMRMQLARLLLSHPDLLLLDEPTNHLDLESSIWFENFLSGYDGAVVIISHDRFFLNRMVKSIAEIERGKLTFYPYPYDRFVIEKQKRREILDAQATRQKKEIERQESFIDRFRAKNTKATAVQSRIKALSKIERIETIKDRAGIGFKFEETGRIGHTPVEVSQVTVAYGDNIVYNDFDFTIRRGERIALVGPNGAGKSTLIKLLAGTVSPKAGRVRIAESVALRHFAQHQVEALDPEKTVLDELTSDIPFDKINRARAILGAFLFRKDDVDKKVKVLSGGEKSRLALAKITLNPTNLLLLDEPTNHLDLKSRQALEKALANYGGCILFISHDRAFINAVANKIVHVEDGRTTEFLGNFGYYESKRGERLQASSDPSKSSQIVVAPGAKKSKKESRQEAAKQRQALNETVGPVKKNLASVEKRIMKIEARLETIEFEMAAPETYKDVAKVHDSSKEIAALKKEVGDLYARWERLSERIERLVAD